MLYKRYMKREHFRVKTRNKIHKANTNRYKAQTAMLMLKKIKSMAKTIKRIKKIFLYSCNS